MVIIPIVLLAILLRFMVDLLFDALHHTLYLNHIQLPPPGWQLEVVKFTLTLMLLTPLVGVLLLANA